MSFGDDEALDRIWSWQSHRQDGYVGDGGKPLMRCEKMKPCADGYEARRDETRKPGTGTDARVRAGCWEESEEWAEPCACAVDVHVGSMGYVLQPGEVYDKR